MDGGPSNGPDNTGVKPPLSPPTSSQPPPSPTSKRSRGSQDPPPYTFDPSNSNATSPPYWTREHNRIHSTASVDSTHGHGISMNDNTISGSETNAACWAKSVTINDYRIVNWSALNVGAFVVWNIEIETQTGSLITLRKRYSDLHSFRHSLLLTFPLSESSIPLLPSKGVFKRFEKRFLEKRRVGLQYFLNCVLLNPEMSGGPVVKEFLFG